MLLAASGLKVTVYEKDDRIGGRTSRVSMGEYHFDRGPTFFLAPYLLEEVFAAAGRRLGDYVELTRLDPMYRLVVGQEGAKAITLDCTQDLEEMARRIGKIEPRDAQAFLEVMRENRGKLAAFEPILRSPFRSPLDLVRTKFLPALKYLGPTMSVHDYLSRKLTHPVSKLALSFQSKYLGMSPLKCPSLFSILPFIEYEFGVWHPTGGCNAVMDGMAKVCAELGVEFETGASVERVVFDGKKARGVVVDGQERLHKHVVLNADASWALKNLIPSSVRPGAYQDATLDKKKYSCSTFMLYLGLDRPCEELAHHTIYVSERYQQNLADIERGGISHDPSVYVHNPVKLDPSLAPGGHSSLYVLVPTSNCQTKMDWKVAAPKVREQALARIGQLAGFDVARHIRAEKQITPDDWRASNINFGATFNLAHNLTQMLHLRPQHRVPGMEGVWLAGGGTHPGSGLPVIWLSSQITSRLLCEELGMKYAGDRVARVPVETAAARQAEMLVTA
jgi:phytoene desaturase